MLLSGPPPSPPPPRVCQAAGFLWSHCITSTYFGTVCNSMQSSQLSRHGAKRTACFFALEHPPRIGHVIQLHVKAILHWSFPHALHQPGVTICCGTCQIVGSNMSTPLTIQVGGQVVQVRVAHCHGLQMGRNGIHRFLLWKCNSSKVLHQGTELYTGSSKKTRESPKAQRKQQCT